MQRLNDRATISSLKATKAAHRMANDALNPPMPHAWPIQAGYWPRPNFNLGEAPPDEPPPVRNKSGFVFLPSEIVVLFSIMAFFAACWLVVWWNQ